MLRLRLWMNFLRRMYTLAWWPTCQMKMEENTGPCMSGIKAILPICARYPSLDFVKHNFYCKKDIVLRIYFPFVHFFFAIPLFFFWKFRGSSSMSNQSRRIFKYCTLLKTYSLIYYSAFQSQFNYTVWSGLQSQDRKGFSQKQRKGLRK